MTVTWVFNQTQSIIGGMFAAKRRPQRAVHLHARTQFIHGFYQAQLNK
jgi:hypothetical protein